MRKINRLRIARKITIALTTNGQGETAKRLQLRGPNEEDLGGFCIQAIIDVVHGVLTEEIPFQKK